MTRVLISVEFQVEADVPQGTLDGWRGEGSLLPDGCLVDEDGFAGGIAGALLSSDPRHAFWEGDARYQTMDVRVEPSEA